MTNSRIKENIQVSQVSSASSSAISLKIQGCNEKLLICQIFDFTLDVDEMKSVNLLNKNWRYIVPMIDVSKSVRLLFFWCVTMI